MIEIPNLKEIRIPSISDVYTNPIFQFLLFCIVLVSAFMSGIIYHLGLYLIPLIDRDSVISTILLYMVFIVGVAAIARGIVVPYVLFLYQFKSHIVNGSLVFIFVKILGAFVPAIMLVVIAFRTLKNTILAIPNYLYLDVIIMFSLLVGAIIILYFWYKSSNKIFFLLSLVMLCFFHSRQALFMLTFREKTNRILKLRRKPPRRNRSATYYLDLPMVFYFLTRKTKHQYFFRGLR